MLKKDCQDFILYNPNIHNLCLICDLSAGSNVSEDSIRKDLQELSGHRKLIKVQGGVFSKSFLSSFNSSKVNPGGNKKRLAQKPPAWKFINKRFVNN